MTIKRVVAGLVAACMACSPAPAALNTHDSPAGSVFAVEPNVQWRLPTQLRELSGLDVTPDGRVFGHDDERAVLYEIDVDAGAFVKSFSLGDPALDGDFEGLAITQEGDFWLTTSQGVLYRFREGGEGASVAFERFDTGLADICDVEGLAVLPDGAGFLLACKETYDPGSRDQTVIYRWDMEGPVQVWRQWPRGVLALAAGVRRFRPSALDVDVSRQRLVMLSAFDGALVELGVDGRLIAARPLGRLHRQAEAAAILPDRGLVIGDEGRAGAQLSRYPPAP